MAARSYIRKVGTGNIYNESDELMAGQSMWFSGPPDKIPAGWLIENGATISRTTYATLFAVIGTTYGAGDGATTFNLPDRRGKFVRGLDIGRGMDAGRVLGSDQADAMQDIRGSFTGNKSSVVSYADGAFAYGIEEAQQQYYATGVNNFPIKAIQFDASRVARTANETRPVNTVAIPIIKYS